MECIICYDTITTFGGCNHLCVRCISKLDAMRCYICGYRCYKWYLLSGDGKSEIPILDQEFIPLPSSPSATRSEASKVYIDGYRYSVNGKEVEKDGKTYKILKS